MKKLLLTLCMTAATICAFAQEKPKSNWVTGEQESSFPGQMIKYAICTSSAVAKGEKGDVSVSINIMEFRGNTTYFLKSTGEDFKVDHNSTQRVYIQFDDGAERQYTTEGNGNSTKASNTLKFVDSHKNNFVKGLKKGKKCKITFELVESGQKSLEFNIEGVDPNYLK